MNLNHITSPKIEGLKKQIKVSGKNETNAFLKEIEETGAPLIEKIEGDGKNILITFLYVGDKDTKNVGIYGAFPSYRITENLMEKIDGTDLWYKTYMARNDIKFKYSFSVNDALDDDYKKRNKNLILDPLNQNKIFFQKDDEDPESEECTYSLVELFNCPKQYWTKPQTSNKTGDIQLHRFKSSRLKKEPRIWVYTPYNYTTSSKPYNLIVLTDGFDYVTDLSSGTVLDNLINSKSIPESICVFIDCAFDRFENLTCNKNFADFIALEVMPWIRENYNVAPSPENTTIGGLSLGGLFASFMGLTYPNIFGNVLSQSGSYWWESEWLTKEYEKSPKLPLNFYLNVGLLEDRPYDSEPIMAEVIGNMRNLLLSKGYNVFFETFPSGHDYLGWGETLGSGLKALNDMRRI